ncbi:hypothetical protein S40288_08086 [Stachybotrys chartarum IBT 40288]|nr:hypothetical protein S40288_08086 [Stachybotrys chartarum IBT 40288]
MSTPLPVFNTRRRETYPAISPTQPALSTKGKNVLITGGGSGIGASITQSFAASGAANIAILARSEGPLLEMKAKIEAAHADTKVWTYVVDISRPSQAGTDSVAAAVQAFTRSAGGKVDVLVANAGSLGQLASIADVDADKWWAAFETNVRGSFNLLRAFDGHAAPGATVIHVSSSVLYIPYIPGYSAYRASKLAAYRTFDYYHQERPDLRVVHYHPGLQNTDMLAAAREEILALGFVFDDAAIAGDFAVWLASEEANFLNGRHVEIGMDVDELKAMRGEIEANPTALRMDMSGVRFYETAK